MGWRVSWQVTCDNCGVAGPRRYKGKRPGESSLQAAKAKGWLEARCPYGMYLHLCAECAAKSRPEWWPVDAEVLEAGRK